MINRQESYTLVAALYVSHRKRYLSPKWVLQAVLNGEPLEGAHWNFTTADFPPTAQIQATLAERIAVHIGCGNHEVIFNSLEWVGV